ncbi:MAG: ChbG/HpnK family deacetylase [Lachnospiraceae bacterium]|nr:ChbG/HpnK family deacetylase [Lachnospiraceae bacterium]
MQNDINSSAGNSTAMKSDIRGKGNSPALRIDVHADDYALTVHTSADILECMQEGKLDSISIVPNTECFEECMEMLYSAIPSLPFLPCMSVHINLVEGLSFSDSYEGAYLNFSWGQLFLYSYTSPANSRIRISIKEEIHAQIRKCMQAVNKCIELAKINNIRCSQKSLRIDSHQHTHHLPIVWNALTEVLKSNKYEVEYIRCSREPLMVFLSAPDLYKTYRPLNAVKNLILTLYSGKIDKYCHKKGLQKMYLWGLLMSGHMDKTRIQRLLRSMINRADRDNRDLEILFHPGLALSNETNEALNKSAVNDFYLSKNRTIEKEALLICLFQNQFD